MKKTWRVVAVGVVVLALVVFSHVMNGKSIGDIPAGTGYAALDLCSRTERSGEAATHVLTHYIEPKVAPLPWVWSVAREAGKRVSVSTWLPFMKHERVAIAREGLGCTVIAPGSTEVEVRAQPFKAAPTLPEDTRPWPLGEGKAETTLLDSAIKTRIDEHATRLFGEDGRDLSAHWHTTALLIARNGHLIYERYGQNYTREQPQLGWSMTKTLTALIAGTLAARGTLSLDEPVGLTQWNGTPKAEITWRALLNMAPGLAWFEGYGGASDATTMLFSEPNQGAWAADRPLTSKPGTVFNYSTGFSNIAMLRMRQLLGGQHQAIYDHYQSALFAPLGIRNGVIEPDASGTPVGGARGFLRPVDWLRLGQLVEQGGAWNGDQVVPQDWIAFMTAASPASTSYGGSMWLPDSDHVAPEVRAKLPKDLAFFAGHQGQFVIVVPSQNLVVLRMGIGLYPDEDYDPVLGAVFAILSELKAR